MQQAIIAKEATDAAVTSQFLTFVLGDEQYGLPILKVQEIKGYSSITKMPNTPRHIKGVINLRGTVVPVVDLRSRFSMLEGEYNKFTVIIVVTVGEKVTGLVVDAVSDVLDIVASEIRPAPDLGAHVDMRFVSGMATVGDRMTVLLDIDRLLSESELADLGSLN